MFQLFFLGRLGEDVGWRHVTIRLTDFLGWHIRWEVLRTALLSKVYLSTIRLVRPDSTQRHDKS